MNFPTAINVKYKRNNDNKEERKNALKNDDLCITKSFLSQCEVETRYETKEDIDAQKN